MARKPNIYYRKWLYDHGVMEHMRQPDSIGIYFGEDDDVYMRWDGTDFDVLPLADDSVIKFGNGTLSFDIWVYGNTSSDYIEWDASANALVTSGVAHLHLSGIDADAGEGVGSVIQMGVSGTPLTSSEDETELISCYAESSGKNIYGMRMQVEKTSATTGAPRALTLRSILSHSSGFAPQGANSVDARVTLETGNTGISGEMHAMESQCRVDAESRVVQGTYAAHKFTNRFRTGNTMPNTTFFARFVDDGEVKTPFMFDFNSCTAGASNCIVADTGAVDGIATTHYLRVVDPDGNTGYIAIFGAMS